MAGHPPARGAASCRASCEATEGCITGPPQRKYVDLIRDRLGWLPLETDEDKKWVQVMGPFLIDPDDYVSAFD